MVATLPFSFIYTMSRACDMLDKQLIQHSPSSGPDFFDRRGQLRLATSRVRLGRGGVFLAGDGGLWCSCAPAVQCRNSVLRNLRSSLRFFALLGCCRRRRRSLWRREEESPRRWRHAVRKTESVTSPEEVQPGVYCKKPSACVCVGQKEN